MHGFIRTPVGNAIAFVQEADELESVPEIYARGRYLHVWNVAQENLPDTDLDTLHPDDLPWENSQRQIYHQLRMLGLVLYHSSEMLKLDLALWRPVALWPAKRGSFETTGASLLRCQQYFAWILSMGEWHDIGGMEKDLPTAIIGPRRMALHVLSGISPEAWALIIREFPEFYEDIPYLLNEGAFSTADLPVVSAGRMAAPVVPPGTDDCGPVAPDTWMKNGVAVRDRMTPTAWRLVNFLWSCRNKSSAYDSDLAEAVFLDRSAFVDNERVGSHRKEANRFLVENACGWKVSAPQNHVALIRQIF